MNKYWTRARLFLLAAVVCFGVVTAAGFGIAFDPLAHEVGWAGLGFVFFAASFFP